MPAVLETNVVIRRHVKALGLGNARAFVLEGDDLGYGPVAPLDGVHSGSLHMVLGITIPNVPRRIHGDQLRRRLHRGVKLLGELPLDPESIPPFVEGDVGLLALCWHPTVVEDHVDVVLGPLRPGVDGVSLLAGRQEVLRRPVGDLVLLGKGGVSTSKGSSPVVLALPLFADEADLLFLVVFAIVGGSFLS